MKDQLLRPESPAAREREPGADDRMTTKHDPKSPAHRDPGRSSIAGVGHAPRNTRAGTVGHRPGLRADEPPSAPDPAPPHGRAPSSGSGAVASVLGFAAAAVIGGVVVWQSSCRNEPPPGPSVDVPPRVSSLPAPSTHAHGAVPPAASASAAPTAAPVASAAPGADKPWTGPWLGGLMLQTVIFPKPEFSKKELGYIRLGGKAPVEPGLVKDTSGKCSQGWYHLVDGGYVCARYATTDIKSPQIRLGITAPNVEDVLPYKYAYNTAHGTPLYRSVPSREEMLKYEPYLEAAKKAKHKADKEKEKDHEAEGDGAAAKADAPADDKAAAIAKADSLGLLDADADAGAPEPEEKPWWQQAADKSKPIHVKLDDLSQDADGTLTKRMVKGFFVAIDKTFAWNDRSWYKTTGGLVAPADRMYIVKPPTTLGMEVPEGVGQVGFFLAKSGQKYEFDAEKKTVKTTGQVARFTPVGLNGATFEYKGNLYRQTTEGWWMKAADGTITEPGPRPADLAPGEKWIDVNLTRKTLVAFEGDRPVYAALVSPGKKSKDKTRDHSTVQGTFRIREKHIAVTMDGDGKLASDLPYSIEDVPYVQYFEGSYALHGAFWHNNFGHEMSHGCVNLSPLDAKKIFYWSEPRLPQGWHAVWSTAEHRGTMVVVHE